MLSTCSAPLECVVSTLYWGLRAIDPKLVVPEELELDFFPGMPLYCKFNCTHKSVKRFPFHKWPHSISPLLLTLMHRHRFPHDPIAPPRSGHPPSFSAMDHHIAPRHRTQRRYRLRVLVLERALLPEQRMVFPALFLVFYIRRWQKFERQLNCSGTLILCLPSLTPASALDSSLLARY